MILKRFTVRCAVMVDTVACALRHVGLVTTKQGLSAGRARHYEAGSVQQTSIAITLLSWVREPVKFGAQFRNSGFPQLIGIRFFRGEICQLATHDRIELQL
jgi:hypothetical protein